MFDERLKTSLGHTMAQSSSERLGLLDQNNSKFKIENPRLVDSDDVIDGYSHEILRAVTCTSDGTPIVAGHFKGIIRRVKEKDTYIWEHVPETSWEDFGQGYRKFPFYGDNTSSESYYGASEYQHDFISDILVVGNKTFLVDTEGRLLTTQGDYSTAKKLG